MLYHKSFPRQPHNHSLILYFLLVLYIYHEPEDLHLFWYSHLTRVLGHRLRSTRYSFRVCYRKWCRACSSCETCCVARLLEQFHSVVLHKQGQLMSNQAPALSQSVHNYQVKAHELANGVMPFLILYYNSAWYGVLKPSCRQNIRDARFSERGLSCKRNVVCFDVISKSAKDLPYVPL